MFYAVAMVQWHRQGGARGPNDLKGCPCKKLQDPRPQEISDNYNPN